MCVYERRRVQYVREGPLSTLPNLLSTVQRSSRRQVHVQTGRRGGRERKRDGERKRESGGTCVGGGEGGERERESGSERERGRAGENLSVTMKGSSNGRTI